MSRELVGHSKGMYCNCSVTFVWTASEALQLLLCPSRFACVLAVFKQLKLLLVRRIFSQLWMRLIWIERLAEACAKSCITSSSLLGGFGPGVGRNREGYGYLLFGWFGCAGIHSRKFEFLSSSHHSDPGVATRKS